MYALAKSFGSGGGIGFFFASLRFFFFGCGAADSLAATWPVSM